jgi:hypothetical protein
MVNRNIEKFNRRQLLGTVARFACHRARLAERQMKRTRHVSPPDAGPDVVPGFSDDSKSLWENDPRWQPLRQFVERLLVT